MQFVISFRSRSDAIAFGRYLSSKAVSNQLINKPRTVSGSCGLAVLANVDHSKLLQLVHSYTGRVGNIYELIRVTGGVRYQLV